MFSPPNIKLRVTPLLYYMWLAKKIIKQGMQIADMQSYEAWENFKYVLKIGDKKFTWYAISLNSGQTLVFYEFICKIPFSFSNWKTFQDVKTK